ncbi:MAG: hypothetical protein FWE71_01120 [Nocardioidaceae bacterium]|nr:hypothetical protein [Nocardioidaceae bacterium]MCL2612724.1 hypothetical protein [Nocardioidaceae bacterium]
MALDRAELHHLLTRVQDGVVSRRQVLELGGDDNDVERMLRRRELTRVHTGVYVDHTGRLTRAQAEWAAVLAFWPAALSEESALPGHRLDVVIVAVDGERRCQELPRVWVRRTNGLARRVDWTASPPRVLLEQATIDVMSRKIVADDVAGAFATLAEVCHSRRTDPRRITHALAGRPRVAGRRILAATLSDLATGACSVLERGYLHRVERAHGLPRASRQHPSTATGEATAHDVRYAELGIEVELDGRPFHDNARGRDADARRDLAELVVSEVTTARVTYGMVFRDGCWTASMIGRLLRSRGWSGEVRRCPRCPAGLDPA